MSSGAGKPTYEQLEVENAALRRRVAALEEQVRKLLEHIEQLECAGKRQAAPFSKGEPKSDPKTAGRKPGDRYGTHARGAVPRKVDEVVPVPLPAKCPDCGGKVEETSVEPQYQTDIPPVKPFVRCFDIHIGYCECCDRRIQPRHPLQTSDALHAAGNNTWGPNLVAHAVHLNKHGGLSWEKVAEFFITAFGIQVARSTLCRAMMRLAGKLRPTYNTLVAALPEQPVIHADETGWRENGRRRWLWAFVAAHFTVYKIAVGRGSDVVLALLPADFEGLLGRDGWSAYGCLENALHQTCLQHLLRRCDGLLEIAPGRAGEYPLAVKALLHDALALRDRREELTEAGFERCRDRIETRLSELLDRRPAWEPSRKLANHLWNERTALLTFLYLAAVEATNWVGEHAMRFAVVLRKICGGNRSAAGCRAQETLLSIERTCRQQGRSVLSIYIAAQHAPDPPKLRLTGPPLPAFDAIDHRLFTRPAGFARPCARER